MYVQILGADLVEHSLSGSYDHKTRFVFDELHNVVGRVSTHWGKDKEVDELEKLYNKLQATNRCNYLFEKNYFVKISLIIYIHV